MELKWFDWLLILVYGGLALVDVGFNVFGIFGQGIGALAETASESFIELVSAAILARFVVK